MGSCCCAKPTQDAKHLESTHDSNVTSSVHTTNLKSQPAPTQAAIVIKGISTNTKAHTLSGNPEIISIINNPDSNTTPVNYPQFMEQNINYSNGPMAVTLGDLYKLHTIENKNAYDIDAIASLASQANPEHRSEPKQLEPLSPASDDSYTCRLDRKSIRIQLDLDLVSRKMAEIAGVSLPKKVVASDPTVYDYGWYQETAKKACINYICKFYKKLFSGVFVIPILNQCSLFSNYKYQVPQGIITLIASLTGIIDYPTADIVIKFDFQSKFSPLVRHGHWDPYAKNGKDKLITNYFNYLTNVNSGKLGLGRNKVIINGILSEDAIQDYESIIRTENIDCVIDRIKTQIGVSSTFQGYKVIDTVDSRLFNNEYFRAIANLIEKVIPEVHVHIKGLNLANRQIIKDLSDISHAVRHDRNIKDKMSVKNLDYFDEDNIVNILMKFMFPSFYWNAEQNSGGIELLHALYLLNFENNLTDMIKYNLEKESYNYFKSRKMEIFVTKLTKVR